MKEELEYIWREKPLAFTLHLAGWLTADLAIELNVGYWHVDLISLVKIKGKKLNPIKRRHKI